jgi:2-oxoglutarate ferredoxin oxidoreductase subunit beta
MSPCNDQCLTHVHDYFSKNIQTWCTNCGNYGIHAAVRRALAARELKPKDVLLCFDIGCHGNGSDKIGGYRFHGLHGRVIPFAAGAACANNRIKVVAFGGDGGSLGEGINHLVHAVRANYNITFVLHNNLNYGLTQGQASATTKPGMKMNSSPDGITSDPLHLMRFLFSLRPSFVARSFSGDVHHMTEVLEQAVAHRGFSFVEMLQSCPTYNKATPHEWYQERVYDVKDRPGYDVNSIEQAMAAADDLEDHIALGVLYKDSDRPDAVARHAQRLGLQTELVDEVKTGDVISLLKAFQ